VRDAGTTQPVLQVTVQHVGNAVWRGHHEHGARTSRDGFLDQVPRHVAERDDLTDSRMTRTAECCEHMAQGPSSRVPGRGSVMPCITERTRR
jgi:hypothetical protein